MNCFDDVTRKTHPQYAKCRLISKMLNEMGMMDMSVKLENIETTHFSPGQKPSRLDYIFSNVYNQRQEIRTIKSCYSDHRILRLSIKKRIEQVQKVFRMDDATVTENYEILKQMIAETMYTTGEQLVNGCYLRMKNEITSLLDKQAFGEPKTTDESYMKV